MTKRWQAVVTYRTEEGPEDHLFQFEEIEDLHDLIEEGPDWNCIISINIELIRVCSPGLTVEQAARQ